MQTFQRGDAENAEKRGGELTGHQKRWPVPRSRDGILKVTLAVELFTGTGRETDCKLPPVNWIQFGERKHNCLAREQVADGERFFRHGHVQRYRRQASTCSGAVAHLLLLTFQGVRNFRASTPRTEKWPIV